MGAALALMGAGGCGGADSRIDLTVGTYGEHIYLYSFDCESLEFTSRGRVEAMDASYVLEEGDMIFAVSECGNGSGVCSFRKGEDRKARISINSRPFRTMTGSFWPATSEPTSSGSWNACRDDKMIQVFRIGEDGRLIPTESMLHLESDRPSSITEVSGL